MILPSKHLSHNRALLTVGATILRHLTYPVTVSALWEQMPREVVDNKTVPPLRYDSSYCSDLLFYCAIVNVWLIVRGTIFTQYRSLASLALEFRPGLKCAYAQKRRQVPR